MGNISIYYNPQLIINSSIFLVPIDELQDIHIGFKLFNFISPPLNSEIIWPHEKLNWEISVNLQHKHFALPILSPTCLFQTFLFRLNGIDFFLGFFSIFSIFLGIDLISLGNNSL